MACKGRLPPPLMPSTLGVRHRSEVMKDHTFSVAALSLLVAAISCAAALVVVPEVRSFLGLTSSPVDSSAVSNSGSAPEEPQENTSVQAPIEKGKTHENNPPVAQATAEVVVEEVNSNNQAEPLQEEPIQLPPKRQTRKSLAGAFVELYYVGEQSDDVMEVMARLARFGATVELHEIYAEEIDATQVIRESPCWGTVGKDLESAVSNFSDVRIETSQESCNLEPLRLFLVLPRSGEQ